MGGESWKCGCGEGNEGLSETRDEIERYVRGRLGDGRMGGRECGVEFN